MADGATEDAHDAHDDAERSDPMKNAGDAAMMLSIAETIFPMESGLTEMQMLVFRRRKQREKQRT
ncbi:MAG: hypothetical protein M3176_16060 [Chloroflexota bacterium]|nr:hypothetical protein [Chloroflexota bacterium]